MFTKTALCGLYILAFMGNAGQAAQSFSQNETDDPMGLTPQQQETLVQERDELEDLYFKLYCVNTYMTSNFHSDEHLRILAYLQVIGESSEGLLGQVSYIKSKVKEIKMDCWQMLMALMSDRYFEKEECFHRLHDAVQCLDFSEEKTVLSLAEEKKSKGGQEYIDFLNEKIRIYSNEIIKYLRPVHYSFGKTSK